MLKKMVVITLVAVLLFDLASPSVGMAAKEEGQGKEVETLQNSPHRIDVGDAAFVIFVAPNGDDSNGDGTSDQPFQTLKRAKEAVRSLPKDQGDIVVEFADGFYPVGETVVFDEKDSGNENCTIYYQAAEGAKPVISGGYKLADTWTETTNSDIAWNTNGKAYKIPLNRNKKLRAIYVNGKRATMTKKTTNPRGAFGNYAVTKGRRPWAWRNSSKTIFEGNTISGSAGLSPTTRNPKNIELETGVKWNKVLVCADELLANDANTDVKFQMPYAAIAQNQDWEAYDPKASQTIYNVFEWLINPGEFYYDQSGKTLYYIPRAGEDMSKAEVVVPDVDTILEFKGSEPKEAYTEFITFSGISFAHSDWNLYELDGSYGYASVQGAIVNVAFGDSNWHNDMYRAFDIPTAAIKVNTSRNIRIVDGEVKLTGCLGVHLENDVRDCEITGNYIGNTGGGGIVIGHLQHIYENDGPEHQVKGNSNNAGPDKEKFKDGTEKVPEDIYITNNYFPDNCVFFPGHSPITSFYTKNMQVLHNFIYRCPYSGMSIGWGWCNFDGMRAGEMSWYEDSQLPGYPTTTSRFNKINYNRVEDICTILQDAGGIYTLGQQGEPGRYSEMNYNFINARRVPKSTDQGRWINGFHPDEGSAYINFVGNVVTNIFRSVYELNNWKRKHHMQVTEGFSNKKNIYEDAPYCTVEQFVYSDSVWPQKGHDIVLASGLERQYRFMVEEDVISPADFELASHVRIEEGGKELKRSGLLSTEDEVWLAPEGTVTFNEGPTMTKAAGHEETIMVPDSDGEYKLYIKYANGTVSKPSTYTLYVGEDNSVANVFEGYTTSVSETNPLKLVLQGDKYEYSLNGVKVSNGYAIAKDGEWELIAVSKVDGSTKSIHFTTTLSEANKLLPRSLTVAPGEAVKLAHNLNDATKTIWIHESGLSAFDENNPRMSKISGDKDVITVPWKTGNNYQVSVVNGDGSMNSSSDARIRIVESPGETDKTQLTSYIDEIKSKGLKEVNYTKESWAALQEALQEAEALYTNASATQTEVDGALSKLKNAYGSLVADGFGQPSRLELTKLPDKTVYYTGDAFDSTGLIVTAIGSNGGKKVLQATEYALSGYDSITSGTKTITASYQGLTVTFQVTIAVKPPESVETVGRVKAQSASFNCVKLTWKEVNGAEGYEVKRAESRSGTYKTVATINNGSAIQYTDKKLKFNKRYYYKIIAYKNANGSVTRSNDSNVASAKTELGVPSSVKISANGKRKATVYWKKVSGANGYDVYISTKKTGKYKLKLTLKGASKKKGTLKGLASKQTYYVKVCAYRTVKGKKVTSKYSAIKKVKSN